MRGTIKDYGIKQCSLFDGEKPLKIIKPLRLIELFAGIGAQAKALENLGVEFEHYRICEFDKYAVASYNSIHGTDFDTSDITQIHAEDLGIVETDKYEYIMTYSFPCTDLSKAGKQQGMSRESGTRSGLLWEVERLLKETKQLPQILLMENVPDVLSEKNCKDFYSWCDFLEKLGYTSKYAILNSKDYGVPQNRERCFMLSWLGEDYYYDFPDKIPLLIRLKDVLEKKVDEKYYLSEKTIKYFIKHTQESIEKGNGFRFEPTDGNVIVKTITTKAGNRMDDNFIKCEHIAQLEGGFEMANRVYSAEGLCPIIRAMQGGGLEPKILEDFYKSREPRVYEGVAPIIRSEREGLKVVEGHRFYEQAFETIKENDCVSGDTIDAFNKKVNKSGVSPTVTTRPEGFKTAILVVDEPIALDEQNGYLRKDGTVGTITTDGSSPKHNNRIVEPMVWDGFNQFIRKDISCVGTLTRNCGADQNCDVRLFQYGHGYLPSGEINSDVFPTVPESNTARYNNAILQNGDVRVRKLTPKECWRLMGFDDKSFSRAEKVVSNSQLYKQAGNSIVVDVLMAIFRNLF